jgi:hypothetical protein
MNTLEPTAAFITPPTITKIHIYRSQGAWYYAAFADSGSDHSDTIDVLDSDTETTVRAEMARQFPSAEIRRCPDVN